MRKDVNLRELCEFGFCCEVRSVLGRSELEARPVGIGARKGRQNNLGQNNIQVVNCKCRVVNGMRDRSNQKDSIVALGRGDDR
jgi:hypothetical protein